MRQASHDAASHAEGLLPFLRERSSRRQAPQTRRVAVVGAGIAGLSAAWALAPDNQVTLFEAGSHFGGHANTVDITLNGQRHGVDTGFLVFNSRTYPLLIELFRQLDIDCAASDMSFSVQAPGLEWSGSNLNTVFAQRSNLLRPAFWQMLADLLRFNRRCTALALAGDDRAMAEPIGAFLDRERFGEAFRRWYLLPMVACIWSCPTRQMLEFPIGTLIRFCHNHGLLQVNDRPQWYTVRGGSQRYVQRMLADLPERRLNCPVQGIRRLADGGVELRSAHGMERFDQLVLATHSDQALALLDDASPAEREVLGAIRYHQNRALLHLDHSQLPKRRAAWAAWNYEQGGREGEAVCLHYLINKLQPLPWQREVIVSLNPLREPSQVLAEFDYAHPVFDQGAIDAQLRLPQLQGQRSTWFAGAWTRYGFHEDGLLSGLRVAQQIAARGTP